MSDYGIFTAISGCPEVTSNKRRVPAGRDPATPGRQANQPAARAAQPHNSSYYA